MLIALMLLASSHPPDKKVEVDGHTYRVRVRDNGVLVAGKGLITGRSPAIRDAMRQAVKLATGCEIVEPYWQGAKLVGDLKCPDQVVPS